ncbi:MAG TPA: magnesium and cobalt transport protein CorA [Syntrophus sp. (in: bacteria)]|nr:MAG: magnesium and cobalt transport protein CorA [Syntrophus sp. GWC2_56_31]HBB16191.1 magnesium and cobalt transport protein CorA [Syntrophus sp. (in: bacteria)]
MPGTARKRSVKTGLPPGSLIHIGQRHAEKANILICEYDESRSQEREIHSLEGVLPPPDGTAVAWIHIDGLQEIPLLDQMGSVFGLHPLILEDILNTEQRPKSEDHGDYLYIVLRLFHEDAGGGLIPEQISIVLGPNWMISLQEKKGTLFDPIRERLRNEKGRLRKAGADYLAHALLDAIVDSYFVVLDKFGEKIENLEDALVGRPSPETLRAIQAFKREIILLRKSVWPLREMLGGLGRSDSPLIREQSVIYFRDVYDHAVQVIDTIETYRDMLSGMLDIYLSSISNRMNEIMKVLTIIATIFMPLTFLAGVYGMNFKHMPELEWPWGYFALWGVMIVIAIFMLIYFRRRRWL